MIFRDHARRLAGHAALLLGWRPDEFWDATPDELGAALSAAIPWVHEATPPLDRETLQRLTERNPDG